MPFGPIPGPVGPIRGSLGTGMRGRPLPQRRIGWLTRYDPYGSLTDPTTGKLRGEPVIGGKAERGRRGQSKQREPSEQMSLLDIIEELSVLNPNRPDPQQFNRAVQAYTSNNRFQPMTREDVARYGGYGEGATPQRYRWFIDPETNMPARESVWR